ncbi:Crp/Fnr family transcriptional regulator [soil metagenome]
MAATYRGAMAHDLLGGLRDDERRLVNAKMTRRAYRKGDSLFFEGDVGDTLHVLRKGRVAVRTSTPAGDVVTLIVLGVGAYFGELALIAPDSRRTASVVALEAVETQTLRAADFHHLLADHPAIERILPRILVEQVERLSHQLLEALYVSADKRVLRRLDDLGGLYEDSGTIDIPIRQEDLASMAGTTRSTVNKVLRQLEDDGIVQLGRGHTRVLDLERLAQRAQCAR